MKMQFAIRNEISGSEIKIIRKKLKLTQQNFAAFLNVSKKTVENWESKTEPINGSIVTLLHILNENPSFIEYYSIPDKKYPLRLWYMFKNEVCTIIDVDEKNQVIELHNYTKHNLFRAFGVNLEPTYEDYEEFLRSRCFPESRDKLKLVLNDLDLPFYDPMLIIEKTQGRMAEDDFWIRIER